MDRYSDNVLDYLQYFRIFVTFQMAQLKVEATLKDMLEQKNKLAYENGKLQSELTQVKTELSVVTVESTTAVQQKKMNEILQDKFLKVTIFY